MLRQNRIHIRPMIKKMGIRFLGASGYSSIRFRTSQLAHLPENLRFKKSHPDLSIPPDKWLFETFRTNYQNYFEDGKLAAKEICQWTETYLHSSMPLILDWGCGTGRIIRHMHSFQPYALLYGADPHAEMIEWNTANIRDVLFATLASNPPTDYPDDYFDLIYGISVLTHLQESSLKNWIDELYRILRPTGIVLLTTHGAAFDNQLHKQSRKQLKEKGILFESIDNSISSDGKRNDTCYVTPSFFEQLISPNFSVAHFFDGATHPEKFGGQDLWILQKK